MKNTDPRIDEYISKAEPFAKPILNHLRKLIHQACPEVEETWKWSFPHFDYKGMMCSFAAFKQHCAFGFWKASIMKDPKKYLETSEREAMGHLGQIRSMNDLPPDEVLLDFIRQAVKLNDEGIKLPSKPKAAGNKELVVPEYFAEALKRNKAAKKTFEDFSYSNKKEYVMWVTEAKSEATREKRMEQALEWMAEGKIKNWKYVK